LEEDGQKKVIASAPTQRMKEEQLCSKYERTERDAADAALHATIDVHLCSQSITEIENNNFLPKSAPSLPSL
jgi:hypothetical protein